MVPFDLPSSIQRYVAVSSIGASTRMGDVGGATT